MGMSGLVLDNVDKFWDMADSKATECKDVQEFTTVMSEHSNLLSGSEDAENFEFELYDVWTEKNNEFIAI